MDTKLILDQLKEFSEDVIILNPPASTSLIENFRLNINLNLPADYMHLVLVTNGFSLMGTEVYGVGPELGPRSIDSLYWFEHNEVSNPMYPTLIPFSPDGFGNHYCFDTNTLRGDSCDIVFWQYDLQYDEETLPEKTHDSFLEWVQEVVIDWTLEEYDHNGNKK